MTPTGHRRLEPFLTPALAATTVAVYALILTGATASLVDAAGACSTWPACSAGPATTSTTVVVALAHRATSLAVGLALLGLVWLVWAVRAPATVRGLVTLTTLVYPVQVAIGAYTALSGGTAVLPGVHLVLGMAIFATTLLALLRWLEWETRDVEASFVADVGTPNPAADDRGATTAGGPAATVLAYLRLTKPRLMWLLCAVALAGIGLASASTGLAAPPRAVLGTLAGGVLAIGASGTFNHVLERDVDRRMARTADRPLATHAVPTRRAIAFGGILAVASVGVFLALVNPLSAGLGLAAVAFYSVVYTVVLKPNTPQNIVIGGAVGAFPALIGWAAVTGAIGLPAVLLGLIIFLWTPAHFYNLALAYKADYARGGFPMLPVVRGDRVTRRHIGYYLGATLLAVVALGAVGGLGWLYVATGVVAAGAFLAAIVHLYRRQTTAAAMRAFHTSNLFLGALMAVIVLETLVV